MSRELSIASRLANPNFEAELVSLLKYGKPRLHYSDNGWMCIVEMNTNAKGVTFDVRSEFGMSTPSAAVNQCKERAIKAVNTIKET